MQTYYVYIMSNQSRTLYTGVTNDLERRVREHKSQRKRSFTQKYNVTRLVWFDAFHDVNQALLAEKRIKGWRRSKKLALVDSRNPRFEDLGAAL